MNLTGPLSVWLGGAPLCWDQADTLIALCRLGARVIEGRADWTPRPDAEVVVAPAREERPDWTPAPGGEGAVVVVPARYHADHAGRLFDACARLPWRVLALTSDEESTFPLDAVPDGWRFWVMTPRPGHPGLDRAEGCVVGHGCPSGTAEQLASIGIMVPTVDWRFSGQVNHRRRLDAMTAMRGLPAVGLSGAAYPTSGFTQGMPRLDYLRFLSGARVAPCPAGPATPDTFRAWEALQAGVLPIVDGRCGAYPQAGYWDLVCGGGPPPFPVVDDWADLPRVAREAVDGWPGNAADASAWWTNRRAWHRDSLASDITQAAGGAGLPDPCAPGDDLDRLVTVVVTTSPVRSHPSARIVEETVRSVRCWLPGARIVFAVDGVRPEQSHLRGVYDEYRRRLAWLALNVWSGDTGDCVIAGDGQWRHQAGTVALALRQVTTPLVLMVEHDTPVVTDEPTDLAGCARAVLDGHVDLVRFHHEAHIPEPHRHLMVDDHPCDIAGVPLLRTVQWSQRPYIAGTAWFRQMLADHFTANSRTMIEDHLHGVCQDQPWARNRLAVYHPPGGNIKRSLHSDGREGDPKYEMWVTR